MKKPYLAYFLMFAIGCVAGFSILLLIGVLCDTALGLRIPRAFGNISIFEKTDTVTLEETIRQVETVWLAKEGVPFLGLVRYRGDEAVFGLVMIDKNEKILLYMKPSPKPGQWAILTYSGHNKNGITTGEEYVDMNCDGHFDMKLVHDSDGNIMYREIYVDTKWVRVDSVKKRVATSGEEKYFFEEHAGWKVVSMP